MTSRRQFLTGCSTLTVTASLAPATCLVAWLPVGKVTLDQISFAVFSAQVGTIFSVCRMPVQLKLVEARLRPTIHPPNRIAEDAQNEKFSLMFAGSKDPVLAQDNYLFEHGSIGRFEMFIVPIVGQNSSWPYYQAVFNRPIQTRLTQTLR